MQNPMIHFTTILPTGEVEERYIEQNHIVACRHHIMVASHYKLDGTCKCDNFVERRMMKSEWGYKDNDFKDMPCRD